MMKCKPGKAGLDFFRKLVETGARPWRLESLRFSVEALEFSLVKDAKRLRLEAVLPRPQERRCLFSNRGLGLRFHGGDRGLPPEDIRAAQAVFQALAGASFPELLRRLMRDALLYSDCSGTQPESRLERYYRIADHTPDWWKFFYRKNNFLDQEMRLGARCVKVNHGSWECRFNSVDHRLAALRFFADDCGADRGGGIKEIHTGLGEKEVLGGKTLEALRAALREAAQKHHPESIHLNSTCLPELLGEDPRPLIAAVEKEFKIPVFWTAKTRDAGESIQTMLRLMLGRIKFSARRDPKAVILAGAVSPEAQHEAERLVAGLGLRSVGFLYPKLDLRSMPQAGSASALIWVNPAGWERLGDEHFIAKGLAIVRSHPPFGLEGTRAWLERIRSVLGLRKARPLGFSADQRAALASLRRGCRGRKVALIGDRADLSALASRTPLGFSIGRLLCEMGFSVKCLVYSPGPADDALRPAEPAGPGDIEFRPFRARAELDGLLRDGIDLAFTHFNHDPRLAALGIAGFCETAFDIGVSGFQQSAERLLHLCRTRPFPGQRAYLGLRP
ncbi:MAG: hypothetical protein NTY77_15825 [Elusimicrobia bacterium]|nr:hypothetical protein [Elusimicrobiota bacterium]